MKKIVFVIEQLYGGGAERVTAALINRLCGSAEIHLVSTCHHDEKEEYPTDPGIIRHINGPSSRKRVGVILGRVAFLRREILKINPDCVVSLATPRTAALITAALLGRRIPVILSERNDPVRYPAEKSIRILRILAYGLCSGLVFQTGGAREYFPGFIQRKGVVISNPITGSLPPRYEGERERRIINCCRLVPQKNIDLLIDAFSDIADDFPDISLEIMGEGPERARLEQKIRDMHLDGRISMPGFVENVYERMQKSSLFVSSSNYEGISNSMLEAIALGVPTVCTDCPAGGARQTIRDGINGLLVPTGDRAALAEAMRRVLSDGVLAEKLSQNGCLLREELSADVIAAKWFEYIGEIVARKKKKVRGEK